MAPTIPEMGRLKGNGNALAAGIIIARGIEVLEAPEVIAVLQARATMAIAEEMRTANLIAYFTSVEGPNGMGTLPEEVIRERLGLGRAA